MATIAWAFRSDPPPGGKIERLSPTWARPPRPGLTGGPVWGIGDFHQVPHPGGRRAVRLPEDSEGQAGLLGVGRGYWDLLSAYICLFIVFNKMAVNSMKIEAAVGFNDIPH